MPHRDGIGFTITAGAAVFCTVNRVRCQARGDRDLVRRFVRFQVKVFH
jgi:hypothetical protein